MNLEWSELPESIQQYKAQILPTKKPAIMLVFLKKRLVITHNTDKAILVAFLHK